jgi:hypothetical protein
MFRVVFGSLRVQNFALERPRRWPIAALFLLVTMGSTGCGHVAAYQRERLAHPTMQLGEMTNPAESHVNAVHEGATGGAVGASSGCGCN